MPAKLHSHLEVRLGKHSPPGSQRLLVDFSSLDVGLRAPALRCLPHGHLIWLLATSQSAIDLQWLRHQDGHIQQYDHRGSNPQP